MRTESLKSALALSCILFAAAVHAAPREGATVVNHVIYTPMRGLEPEGSMNKANLSYHNGPTITSAKVVFYFWGSAFCVGGADRAYATTLQAYRNQLGTTPEYAVITQYSGILAANLGTGTADLFDCTNPPVNVTDAIAQGKVNTYLSFFPFDASTIYEVVLPTASYSTASGLSSCGGPNPQYCAYHSWIGSGVNAIKYSVQPYPNCSGCRTVGWTNVQNQEHFVCHETREAVTDPEGNGWWELVGVQRAEADDKCAWTPTPFLGTGGYAYQWEWSNAFGACRKTLP
jgi:hypothetical protein